MSKTVQLRHLARIVNGGTPTPDPDNWEGSIPWATPVDLGRHDGQDLEETVRTLTEDGLRTGSASVSPGSVIISTRAPVGYVARTTVQMAFNQGCKGLELRPDVDSRFMVYAMKHLVPEMRSAATGTTFLELSTSKLASLRLPLLPIETQRAIADFLDQETSQIDAMIEAQEDLINTLEERRDSVLLSVLFSDQDLDDEPTAWYGASQWDAPKLWRHAKITNGSTPRRAREDYWGGDFPWLKSSVVNLDTVTDADQFVTETALKECHLPVLPAGSILVGLTGQGKTRGKATELQIEATINQHIAAVIPDVNYWNSRFLTLALRSAYDELRRISDANGATKGALTCEALSAFRIPLPPLKEQELLAEKTDETTSRTNDLIAAANDVITLLRERREALITAAVTGRIDPHTGIERIDHLDHVNNATFVNV